MQVHEITPPDELPSDEEDPLLEPQQQEQFQALHGSPAEGSAQQNMSQQSPAQQGQAQQQGGSSAVSGGGGGGGNIEHISEVASVPGMCQSGEGTCGRHEQVASLFLRYVSAISSLECVVSEHKVPVVTGARVDWFAY